MSKDQRPDRAYGYDSWYSPSAGVESVLFVAVQAIMFLCLALVAAQLFAPA